MARCQICCSVRHLIFRVCGKTTAASLIAAVYLPLHVGAQSPPAASAPAAVRDVVGKTIHFGQGGGSEKFRVSGWGDTEPNFTWSLGNSATLSFPVSSAGSALNVRFKMSAMINPPSFPQQPVELLANGHKIADWQVGSLADFRATVPADVVKSGNGVLKLQLNTPKATSPKSVNQGNDARVLGVCCWEIEITNP